MTAQVLPGIETGRTVTPRRFLLQAGKDREVRIPGLIDSSNSYDGANTSYEKHLRAGSLMARDSTSGKWMPVKRSKAVALGSASTALTVDNAAFFKAGDSIRVGNNTAQAIVSINYTTNVITLTTAITWADNAPVYVSGTDRGTARGILLDDEVKLWDHEHVNNVDKTAQIMIAGYVDQDLILGDITAVLEHYDSAFALRDVVFDDYQVGIDAFPNIGLQLFRRQVVVTGNYTVTAADNGTLFVATAAAVLTLPTKAAGLYFGLFNAADNAVSFASASSSDDIIADGDAAADSVAFSTSSHKIGSAALVFILDDLTAWGCLNLGGTAATVT